LHRLIKRRFALRIQVSFVDGEAPRYTLTSRFDICKNIKVIAAGQLPHHSSSIMRNQPFSLQTKEKMREKFYIILQ
jgi:hypothetical protein